MLYSGTWGKLIHEKNQKSKTSWHCPFKGAADLLLRGGSQYLLHPLHDLPRLLEACLLVRHGLESLVGVSPWHSTLITFTFTHITVSSPPFMGRGSPLRGGWPVPVPQSKESILNRYTWFFLLLRQSLSQKGRYRHRLRHYSNTHWKLYIRWTNNQGKVTVYIWTIPYKRHYLYVRLLLYYTKLLYSAHCPQRLKSRFWQ